LGKCRGHGSGHPFRSCFYKRAKHHQRCNWLVRPQAAAKASQSSEGAGSIGESLKKGKKADAIEATTAPKVQPAAAASTVLPAGEASAVLPVEPLVAPEPPPLQIPADATSPQVATDMSVSCIGGTVDCDPDDVAVVYDTAGPHDRMCCTCHSKIANNSTDFVVCFKGKPGTSRPTDVLKCGARVANVYNNVWGSAVCQGVGVCLQRPPVSPGRPTMHKTVLNWRGQPPPEHAHTHCWENVTLGPQAIATDWAPACRRS
jgi:hypothetical protein